jgi:hypothetical protein
LIKLIESISSYASYLAIRNQEMKKHHSSPEPAVIFSDAFVVKYVEKISPVSSLLHNLDSILNNSCLYQKIFVNDLAPKDKRKRYLFIQELEKGLSSPFFFFTYTHQSNVGNYHFIWKAPKYVSVEACSSENVQLVEEIKNEIPVFHTRMMRQEFYDMYGRISPKTKPYILRSIYNSLTGDCSAARTTSEEEINQHAAETLSMEDPDILVDLRKLNNNGKDNFDVFWNYCASYLLSCTSVHERRHDNVTFMAKAISIRDLIEQVSKLILSQSWVMLNFCPRNPCTLASKRYTGRLEAKHVVQKRQFRKSHVDSHYCAAIFRYMRDYAIKFRNISCFACIDDKHRI